MAINNSVTSSYVLHIEVEYSTEGFTPTAHYRARLIRAKYADRFAYGDSEHEALYRLGRYIYEVETDTDIEGTDTPE